MTEYTKELLEDFSAMYFSEKTQLINSESFFDEQKEPRVRLTYSCADGMVREAIFTLDALDNIIRAGVRAETKEGRL